MIELRNINKSYPLPRHGRKEILRNASITFRPGVNMGILGLNGQGKSTSSASSVGRNDRTAAL